MPHTDGENAPDLATPHWHGQVLAQREEALERGEDQLEDWYQAREKIEKEVCSGQLPNTA